MVLCTVIGCSKQSGRDKDVLFYTIPKTITHKGKQEYELTKRRQAGFLAGISREGLRDTHILEMTVFILYILYRESQRICTMKVIQIGYLVYILVTQKL